MSAMSVSLMVKRVLVAKIANNIMKKFLQIPVVASVYLWAVAVSAQTIGSTTDNGLSNQPGIDITVQSLYGIIAGLACWFSRFSLVLIVMMTVWYGIGFITSQGDPGAFGKAKKGLTYCVIGTIVILGAYTIIATVGNGIQSIGAKTTVTAWNNILPLDCSAY